MPAYQVRTPNGHQRRMVFRLTSIPEYNTIPEYTTGDPSSRAQRGICCSSAANTQDNSRFLASARNDAGVWAAALLDDPAERFEPKRP